MPTSQLQSYFFQLNSSTATSQTKVWSKQWSSLPNCVSSKGPQAGKGFYHTNLPAPLSPASSSQRELITWRPRDYRASQLHYQPWVFPSTSSSTTSAVRQIPSPCPQVPMNLHYATPPHVRVHYPHWTHIQSPIGRFSSKSVRSPLSDRFRFNGQIQPLHEIKNTWVNAALVRSNLSCPMIM